jgi:MATE family multidrug resistance protein
MADVSAQSSEASRRPTVELLNLALPTVAQSVSYTVMQFIDTWMLSRLGTDAPTAAGNAGIISFGVICFGFGVMLIVNTLVSQSFGRREFEQCGRFLWQGFWVGTAYALLVLPMVFVAPYLFNAFRHPQELAVLETKYLQIVLLATLFKMIATAAGQFLLGTDRPTMVFVSSVIGVSVNAVAAYAVVLGHFGAPNLGVVGAAWAQNLGVFTEMSVLLVFIFLFGRDRAKFSVADWKPRLQEATTLVKIGAGAGLQIVADVAAWSLFLNLVIAQLGVAAMAANQFMFRYMVVSFMPAVGISQAVTALVGRYIGMKKFDLAMRRADLGFVVAAAYMLLCGLLMATLRHPLIHVFTQDPEVARLGAILLIFAGIYQFFDAMYIVYNGALRGAGDTLIPGFVTIGLCWGITVGGGYVIAHNLPQFGVTGPWVACTIYGILLGIFMVHRFRSGRWQQIHLERDSRGSNLPDDSTKVSSVSPQLTTDN